MEAPNSDKESDALPYDGALHTSPGRHRKAQLNSWPWRLRPKASEAPHTLDHLTLSELNFEPNSSLTHMQEIQTLPGDLFLTRGCAFPAKGNKTKGKKVV